MEEFEKDFINYYNETYQFLMSLVTKKCRNTHDIGDIAQEVYIEIYNIIRKKGVRFIREPKALVARIAKQKLHQYYKTHKKEQITSLNAGDYELFADTADIEFLSTEEIAEDHAVLDWVDKYLNQKGDIYRKIFHLYYRFGMTIPEIAGYLEISESDVKNKIYRTLKEIKEYWRERNENI